MRSYDSPYNMQHVVSNQKGSHSEYILYIYKIQRKTARWHLSGQRQAPRSAVTAHRSHGASYGNANILIIVREMNSHYCQIKQRLSTWPQVQRHNGPNSD